MLASGVPQLCHAGKSEQATVFDHAHPMGGMLYFAENVGGEKDSLPATSRFEE